MTNFKMNMLALVVAGAASSAMAAVPHTFTANSSAKAAEVNENFTALDNGIAGINAGVSALTNRVVELEGKAGEQPSPTPDNGVVRTIDCASDADVLKNYLLGAKQAGSLTINASGTCNGPLEFNKDSVKLIGANGFSVNGGAEVDGEPDEEFAIINKGRHNIRIENLVINSGSIFLSRGSNTRIVNSTIQSAPANDTDDDGIIEAGYYVSNVDVRRGSELRWEGPLSNMAVDVEYNSYLRLDGAADVSMNTMHQLEVGGNSSLESRVDHLIIMGEVYVSLGGVVDANTISAKDFSLENGAVVEADVLNVQDRLRISRSSALEADEVTAGQLHCSASGFYISDSLTLEGTDENNQPTLRAIGCSGGTGELEIVESDVEANYIAVSNVYARSYNGNNQGRVLPNNRTAN